LADTKDKNVSKSRHTIIKVENTVMNIEPDKHS